MKFLKFAKQIFGNAKVSEVVKESDTAYELIGRFSMMFFAEILPTLLTKNKE